MLDASKLKYPNIKTLKMSLQDISFNDEFNSIIAIDTMENVFPEDWLNVLQNFYMALKSEGYLYLTVELMDELEVESTFNKGIERGSPVVESEYAIEGGYHYYPSMEKARKSSCMKYWLQGRRYEHH